MDHWENNLVFGHGNSLGLLRNMPQLFNKTSLCHITFVLCHSQGLFKGAVSWEISRLLAKIH